MHQLKDDPDHSKAIEYLKTSLISGMIYILLNVRRLIFLFSAISLISTFYTKIKFNMYFKCLPNNLNDITFNSISGYFRFKTCRILSDWRKISAITDLYEYFQKYLLCYLDYYSLEHKCDFPGLSIGKRSE